MSTKYRSLTDKLTYQASSYWANSGMQSVGSITYISSSPWARWTEPKKDAYQVATVNRVLNSTSYNSVSTPGFYVKKSVHREWKPKKFRPPRQPVPPRFNPPVSLHPFRPKRPPSLELSVREEYRLLAKRSDSARYRYIQRRYRAHQKRYIRFLESERIRRIAWEKRVAAREEVRRMYILRYNTRYFRYELRMRAYNNLLQKMKYGYRTVRWVRNKPRTLPQNPYTREEIIDLGFTGQLDIKRTASFFPSGGSPNLDWVKNGDFVYSRCARSGYFGSSYDGPDGALTYGGIDINYLTGCADDKAISNLFENISDQKVHIGNMIAERAQTFDLIASSVTRIARFISSPRQAIAAFLSKGAKKGTLEASNDFLAFSFGVRPLISDIYGAAQSLARLDSSIYSDTVIVHGRSTMTDLKTDKLVNWYYTDSQTTRCKVTIHYRLEYKITNGTASTLKNLGLINPAEIAWEVLPWSFVIDWILPIGNYIQSLTAETGLTFITGSKTVTVETQYQAERSYDSSKWWGSNSSWNASGQINGQKTVKTKVRTVLGSAPGTRLPSFRSPASFQHLMLTLALLRQRIH